MTSRTRDDGKEWFGNASRIVALGLALCAGCEGACGGSASGPSPLAGDLRSHLSEEQARAVLGVEAGAWETIERDQKPAVGRRSELELSRVHVASFEIYGVSGNLELKFFNRRLMRTEFSPSDMRAFLDAHARRFPALAPGSRVMLEPHTMVQVPGSTAVIVWEDVRLAEELGDMLGWHY